MPSRPWRMTRIQTRISHVHPTASIRAISLAHYSGYATAECYVPAHRRPCCGALGSQWLRVRSPWSDGWKLLGRLGDRGGLGAGPGPAEDRAQGRSRRTGGRLGSGPTTSIQTRNAGGAFTNRMTAETLRVRADISCVIYICTWAVTAIRKWY